MAAHVHDSVLQPLSLIQKAAGDPREVVRLARREERELRHWLFDPERLGRHGQQPETLADAVAVIEQEVEDSYDLLTPREKEILQLVAEGKTNKEVANILKLSLYTVESHRGNILEKLNLHSIPELILYAVRKGIIS